MTIWFLAAVLFLLLAGLGFLLGAIRTSVMIVGVWVGAKVAVSFGDMLMPYLPKLGIESPFWMKMTAPWVAFFVVQLAFLILGCLVHWKIAKYFRFQTDEVTQLKWARLIRYSGMAFGLVMAVGYLIVTCYFVYFAGYLTTQMSSNTPPKGFEWITTARQDLTATGMDKFIAKRDTMPADFYQAIDILALIYHNPLLHHRLSGYPPFLSLAERREFKAIANDSSFNEMLQTKGDFTRIYDNPKIQSLLKSSDITGELMKLNLDDLENYLKTGETEVYREERFVGRWKLDNYLTTRDLRKQLADLPASTAKLVRKALLLVDINMVNTLEGKSLIRVNIPADEITRMVEEATAKSAAANAARANAAAARSAQLAAQQQSQQSQQSQPQSNAYTSRMQETYGLQPTQPQQNQPVAQNTRRFRSTTDQVDPAAKATEILGKLSKTVTGRWEKDRHKYAVHVKDGGDSTEMEARIVEGDLILINGDMRLTFYKN